MHILRIQRGPVLSEGTRGGFLGKVLAKSTVKEESFCLARKDLFQTLSVEVTFPATPAGALAAGPAPLSADTPEKALASGKALFFLPSQGQCLRSRCSSGEGLEEKHLGGAPAHP